MGEARSIVPWVLGHDGAFPSNVSKCEPRTHSGFDFHEDQSVHRSQPAFEFHFGNRATP
jgi:hypothetical protein